MTFYFSPRAEDVLHNFFIRLCVVDGGGRDSDPFGRMNGNWFFIAHTHTHLAKISRNLRPICRYEKLFFVHKLRCRFRDYRRCWKKCEGWEKSENRKISDTRGKANRLPSRSNPKSRLSVESFFRSDSGFSPAIYGEIMRKNAIKFHRQYFYDIQNILPRLSDVIPLIDSSISIHPTITFVEWLSAFIQWLSTQNRFSPSVFPPRK